MLSYLILFLLRWETPHPLVVNQFSLKPLVELLSSASSVDSRLILWYLVLQLLLLLFSFPLRSWYEISLALAGEGNKEEGRTLTLLSVMVRVAMCPFLVGLHPSFVNTPIK